MEKTNGKNSRIAEISILLVVLVCAALILFDLTSNVVKEYDSQNQPAVIQVTATPKFKARPTLPADFTPDAVIDS